MALNRNQPRLTGNQHPALQPVAYALTGALLLAACSANDSNGGEAAPKAPSEVAAKAEKLTDTLRFAGESGVVLERTDAILEVKNPNGETEVYDHLPVLDVQDPNHLVDVWVAVPTAEEDATGTHVVFVPKFVSKSNLVSITYPIDNVDSMVDEARFYIVDNSYDENDRPIEGLYSGQPGGDILDSDPVFTVE